MLFQLLAIKNFVGVTFAKLFETKNKVCEKSILENLCSLNWNYLQQINVKALILWKSTLLCIQQINYTKNQIIFQKNIDSSSKVYNLDISRLKEG